MTEKKKRSERFKYCLSKGYPYAVASYAAKPQHSLTEALMVKWGFRCVGSERGNKVLYYREHDCTYLTRYEDDSFELYTSPHFVSYKQVCIELQAAN